MTKKQAQAGEPARSFEIDAPSLRAALADVAGVVEKRNTIPVLSNVLMVVTPSALTLTATDLEAWGERHVTLDGTADAMSLTVEADVLNRIAKKLPSEASVRFAYADGKLTVSAGRSRFSLPTLPIEDFPVLPSKDWDAEFEMQAIYLSGALSTVGFAASTEETRYYLGGVFMHAPEGADLRFAATDGHRLARGVMALPDGAEALPDVIIPRKIVKVLTSLLDRHEGQIEVRVSATSLRFEIGQTVVHSKVIDGTFPDYTRVIPSSHTSLLKVDREQLAASVARVTTISSDKTRAVKMVLDKDMIVLSVTSPENGTAVEELSCDYVGPALTIGFNARYLGEVLGHLNADQIEATFTDSAGPALWRDREGANATFVLMPLRV
ncbi:DNA polymerase III subunit beta [Sphingomonas sp. A2-49]|uniref:DNA polymerase III subunit beta n=1 Tax=Sphingomonas sp. A2-49 TaxID=1391375 RepID=UPI0021D38DC0|nr:DNA polymerase III subunit beta [Sphingomonas sp. A2-49]MCU6454336.1 DNA polymerase III subunit beta [Sphingomonas sp. A2-49]